MSQTLRLAGRYEIRVYSAETTIATIDHETSRQIASDLVIAEQGGLLSVRGTGSRGQQIFVFPGTRPMVIEEIVAAHTTGGYAP